MCCCLAGASVLLLGCWLLTWRPTLWYFHSLLPGSKLYLAPLFVLLLSPAGNWKSAHCGLRLAARGVGVLLLWLLFCCCGGPLPWLLPLCEFVCTCRSWSDIVYSGCPALSSFDLVACCMSPLCIFAACCASARFHGAPLDCTAAGFAALF